MWRTCLRPTSPPQKQSGSARSRLVAPEVLEEIRFADIAKPKRPSYYDLTVKPVRRKLMKKLGMLGVPLVASVLCATPISLHWSANTLPALSVERADARLGRPLTPMSVADVNRQLDRHTYRQNYGNPYVNYGEPYVNNRNPYVNPMH
jgi:hypothetical protein